jgi:hypothetical protein
MERSLVKESAAGHHAGVPGRFAALVRIHQVPEDTTNETALPSEQTRCAYDDLLNRRRQAIYENAQSSPGTLLPRIQSCSSVFLPPYPVLRRRRQRSIGLWQYPLQGQSGRHRPASVWSPRARSCETRAVNLRWPMQLGPAADGASSGCHPLAARSP